ncbi:MAG: ABC transporter ATP-binding protein [Planctomycetota bacterium]
MVDRQPNASVLSGAAPSANAGANSGKPGPDIVLEVERVHHWYGKTHVLHDVNLRVARGQIVALVGPSGCGKSTLLRAILGTHQPSAGEVRVHGERVVRPSRRCGMVYQRYSLFPFLTAEENVAIGPILDQTSLSFRALRFFKFRDLRRELLAEARRLLCSLQLEHALRHYPSELSGGMCQRVAIAQAIILKPEILLLDEPFGALDEATREEMQRMLLDLYEENLAARRAGRQPPYTIVIVTHELNEALHVSDRVAGLSQYWNWAAQQHATPPGATIVYDAVAPVSAPGHEVDFTSFAQQRGEIRDVVFNADLSVVPQAHVRFWQECAAGLGQGIMAP